MRYESNVSNLEQESYGKEAERNESDADSFVDGGALIAVGWVLVIYAFGIAIGVLIHDYYEYLVKFLAF